MCCLGRAEAHDVFDAGAVVPAPVEDHDFAAGGKALDIALHVHLALLAVGRRRQRDDAEDARADPLGDGLDRAALARRVAPLEHDDHAFAGLLDPILQVAELDLQLVELLLILLALELFRFFFARHDAPPRLASEAFFRVRPSWVIIKGRNGRSDHRDSHLPFGRPQGDIAYRYGFTGTMAGVSRLGGVLCQARPSLACR